MTSEGGENSRVLELEAEWGGETTPIDESVAEWDETTPVEDAQWDKDVTPVEVWASGGGWSHDVTPIDGEPDKTWGAEPTPVDSAPGGWAEEKTPVDEALNEVMGGWDDVTPVDITETA